MAIIIVILGVWESRGYLLRSKQGCAKVSYHQFYFRLGSTLLNA